MNYEAISESCQLLINKFSQANEAYGIDPQYADMPAVEGFKLLLDYPYLVKEIPRSEYFTFGSVFYYLLERFEESSVYHTLSALGYFFLSSSLNDKFEMRKNLFDRMFINSHYMKRIFLLNWGARTFYKSVEKAMNMSHVGYINFNNYMDLPISIKYVLMMEYADIHYLLYESGMFLEDVIGKRKEALEMMLLSNENLEFNKLDIVAQGKQLHSKVLEYLETVILINGEVLFK